MQHAAEVTFSLERVPSHTGCHVPDFLIQELTIPLQHLSIVLEKNTAVVYCYLSALVCTNAALYRTTTAAAGKWPETSITSSQVAVNDSLVERRFHCRIRDIIKARPSLMLPYRWLYLTTASLQNRSNRHSAAQTTVQHREKIYKFLKLHLL